MCFDASRTAAGWSSLTTPETGGNTPLRVPERPESQTSSIPRGRRVAAGGLACSTQEGDCLPLASRDCVNTHHSHQTGEAESYPSDA